MADENKDGTGTPDAVAQAAAEKAAVDKTAADKAAADKAAADAAARGKTDDNKPGDQGGKDGKSANADTPKAPEKYSLKLPDGTRLSTAHVTELETLARELNLPNAAAQKVLDDLHARTEAKVAGWLEQTTADKDYGGDKLPESQRLAKLVIDTVRPAGHPRRDAFNAFLNSEGAGNHPEIVAFFADLGKLMAEDQPTRGGQPGGQRDTTKSRDAADVLYGGPK